MKEIKVEMNFVVEDDAVKRSGEICNEIATEFSNRLKEEKLVCQKSVFSSDLRIIENSKERR